MTMIERAARGVASEARELQVQPWCESYARAALLAALDPEALRETIMRAIQQGAERNGAAPYDAVAGNKHYMEMLKDEAEEVIKALRSLAQEQAK